MYHNRPGPLPLIAQQRYHPAFGVAGGINAVDPRRGKRPAVAGRVDLLGGEVAARKHQQAGLVETQAQPGSGIALRQIVERAGLVQLEASDAGAPQRRQVPAHTERGADVAGQRADVGSR